MKIRFALFIAMVSLSTLPGHCPAAQDQSPSASTQTEEERDVIELLNTLAARLALMPDVAVWKFKNGKDIDDPVREEKLLDLLEKKGGKLGLTADFVRNFFQHQFEAAKMLQRRFCEANKERISSMSAPDLTTEIRPQITTLTEKILSLLARLASSPDSLKRTGKLLEQHREILAGVDRDIVETTLKPFR